jgi:GAF domain-containing protein
LRVISASPTDLQPTLDAIAARATILTGAANGAVSRFDGSLIHFAAAYGWTAEELEPVQRDYPRPPGMESTTGRAILTREVVHIADASTDTEYRLQSVLQTTMRTGLSVPILEDGNPVGAITVTRREVAPFSEAQIGLLKTFADQAVIAIENVRLFNELSERTRDLQEALQHQTATAEVLQVINSSPGDLTPVFDAILEKAHTLYGAAHGVMVIREGEGLRTVAANGEPAFVEAMQQFGPMRPPDGSGAARLIRGEQLVHIADFQAESFLENAPPQLRRVSELGRIRTVAMVPLRKDDAVIGFITAFRQEVRPFSDKQIALLQNFAAQAAIAMENARLLGELRERTNDLEESLEYQTATSDVLQVISRSIFDLKPVLDTVIQTAARLCQADVGFIVTRDGEGYRPLATFAVAAPERDALIQTRVFKADNTTVLGHAILERKVIHVADVTTEPAYASSPRCRASDRGPNPSRSAAVAPGRTDRCPVARTLAGRAVHRPPDRIGAHLRRSSSDRNGECAAIG